MISRIAISDILIFCSASSKVTLQQCPDDEVIQHVTIGAIVAATALFSFVAAFYALNMVFDEALYSFAIAVVWGLFIFSLDRLIVSTISIEESVAHKIFGAIIRLCLAAMVSVTISHPLKLRIYQDEINQELVILRQNALGEAEDDFQKKLRSMDDDLKNRLSEIAAERGGIAAQISVAGEALARLIERDNQMELDITCNCYGRGAGCAIKPGMQGPFCRDATNRKARREKGEQNRLNTTISKLEGRIEALNSHDLVIRNSYNENVDRVAKQHRGRVDYINSTFSASLVSRTNALHLIGGDTSPLGLLITILFLVVETAPVIVKLLAGGGVYGVLIRDEKRGISAFVSSPDRLDGGIYKELERFRIEVQARHDQMWKDHAQHLLERIKPLFLARFDAAVSCWESREFSPEHMANELEGWFRRIWANIATRGEGGLKSKIPFQNSKILPSLYQNVGSRVLERMNHKMLMHAMTSVFLFAGMYYLYIGINPTPDQKDAVTLSVSLVAIYFSACQLRAALVQLLVQP